jgi:hypothetical protein
LLNILMFSALKMSLRQAGVKPFSAEERSDFERIFERGRTEGIIQYASRFPKRRFLSYIAAHHDVLLHGSNQKDIKMLKPRKQTLFNGKTVEAVFATRDGIWPVFYAVLDRHKLRGNMRNGCITAGVERKLYFFSLTAETLALQPWTSGMIYFLPGRTFSKASERRITVDEWISHEQVEPITKLEVEPEDFYFIDRVAVHQEKESILKTWLLYRRRTRQKNER